MTQRKIVSAIGMVTVCAIGLANTGLIIFAANGSSVKHQVRQFIVAREWNAGGANLEGLICGMLCCYILIWLGRI
ncbi:hypothetical protein QUA35_18325 [Microcoleus sp. N9_B2]|uniref:hypothetical protein n=1 Tax=unclassified Microcoleus TaxID=2642155 RepID=UPI002FD3CF87